MTAGSGTDWNPEAYDRFRGLRLRPALDLLAQVPGLPAGEIVDLGCGSGAAGPALAQRFAGRVLHGLDRSPAMLEQAEQTGAYARLEQGNMDGWQATAPVALIFSNAALNWVGDHAGLLPRLAGQLAPGGVLAVQCPRQQQAPSHALLRSLSAQMFPDRFDWTGWREEVEDLSGYDRILTPLGRVSLWETVYAQVLPADPAAHPVRRFTESTAARRVLDRLDGAEAEAFLARYDAALEMAYPRRDDGSVLLPFRRIFFTLTRPEG
ncbi:methyltransferase domain-containing protein [Mangrovicoccus algicola]|uniref:Methyltransferase domain-containing protein n=1 Tax=Mangrovicoccus algicola TaxID=2771008 RepID=A0A8J6ZD93_9RHOB|nr:methyltransferase domain-containing protein [Mangrovicoccus algicola]MBE3640001.1 methyltransferase domain-containing protein [Mangrovicoccus algicola]